MPLADSVLAEAGARLHEMVDGLRRMRARAAGRDVDDDGTLAPMHAIATFTTFDLGDGTTLFCRLFERLIPDTEPPGPHPVEDPALIQPGLELIKTHLEGAAGRRSGSATPSR